MIKDKMDGKSSTENPYPEEGILEEESVNTETTDSSEEIAEEDIPESDSGEEETAEESPEEAGKKGSRKKFKMDKKQDALKQRVAELEDRVMRQMAEFENFRKRTEKEKSQMFETGAKSVIEKMLPIVDNFERGLGGIPEEEKNSSFAEGMNMIYRQLLNELENLDVKVIETVGKEFNPDLHHAVMQVESEDAESGTIAQEMQKGYTYRDTVVRYSMVAVVS